MIQRIFYFSLAVLFLSKCGFITIDKDDKRFALSLTNGLVWTGPDSFEVGTCQPFNIKLLDPSGVPLTTSQELTVELSQSGSAKFYVDSTCLTQISQVALQSGVSATVYVSDLQKESLLLVARSTPSQFFGVKATQALAGAATQLAFAFPINSPTYQCIPGKLQALDAFQNTSSRHANLPVLLNASGLSGFHFFSDVFCLNPISQTTLNAGSEDMALYVQATAPGTAQLTGTTAGLTSAQLSLQFSQGQSPYLSLVGPSGNVEVDTCTAVVVETRKPDGNYLLVLEASLPIQASVLSGVQANLFSDALCSVSLTSLAINPQQFQTTFYIKTTQAPQTVSLTAGATGFLSGSKSITFIPKPAALVQLSGIPATINAGTCVQGLATIKDAQGNDAYVSANTTVNFNLTTPDVTQSDIFASNNCSGGVVSSVTIPKCTGLGVCQSGVGFSLRPKKLGSATLMAASTGLLGSSQSYMVQAVTGVPSQVELVRLTSPAVAGACLQYALRTFDAYGNALLLNAARTMALTSSSSVANFYDGNCQTQITSMVFPANTNEITFGFKDPKAESVLLNAVTTDFQAQNTTLIIAGEVKKLVFQNLPSQLAATACSSAIQVVQKDGFDNLTLSAVTFNLASTLNGQFFSDSLCSVPVTQGSIAAGNSASSNLYVSVPQNGLVNLTATGTSPISLTQAAAASLNVTLAPALHLVLNCDGGNCSALTAGECRKLNLASLDSSNIPFIPVGQMVAASISASTASTTFYSNASCTTSLTNNLVSLSNSNNPGVVYVRDTTAETMTVTASATGVQPASLPLTVNAGFAEKLWVSSTHGPSSFFAQTCSGPYQLTVQDRFGNTTLLDTASPVVFGASLWNGSAISNQAQFSSDSLCANTSISIPAAASTTTFYVKTSAAGTLVVRPQGINLGYANERSLLVNESALLAYYNGSSSISGINFNTVPQGSTSSTGAITLKNTSASAVAIVASLTGPASPFAIRNNTCVNNTTLIAGATCTFIVDFTPTSQTSFNGSIIASYDTTGGGASSTATLNLTGVGGVPSAASLVVAPNTHDFGSQLVNSTTTKNFTLTNQGGQAADTISLDQYGSSFTGALGTCAGTLPPGSSCTFSVSFAPTASGSYSSGIRLNYRNTVSGTTVNHSNALVVSGSAQKPASLIFQYLEYGFGSIPRYAQVGTYLLVQNFGDRTATNITISMPSAGTSVGFSAGYGTCSTTLAAGQSCYLYVGFYPYYVGYVSTNVKLNYQSDSTSLTSGSVTLTGYGY